MIGHIIANSSQDALQIFTRGLEFSAVKKIGSILQMQGVRKTVKILLV